MAQDTDIFQTFRHFVDGPQYDFAGSAALAVAVSGGPDSMALAYGLAQWAQDHGGAAVRMLIVDHDLRAESAHEAQMVKARLTDYPCAVPVILTWDRKDEMDARVQEEARHARYDLMAEYCAAHGISALFLALHMDDQAETVLFRLEAEQC